MPKTRSHTARFIHASSLAGLLALGGAALASYNEDAAMQEITAQALKVKPQTPPLAESRLTGLLPGRCAGKPRTALRQSTGHTEARYGTLTLTLDDYAGNVTNTVMGAGLQLGLHAGLADAVLVRPAPGALGYTVYEPNKNLAQTRVWAHGRYLAQLIQTSAHSRADVDACLKALNLRALPDQGRAP